MPYPMAPKAVARTAMTDGTTMKACRLMLMFMTLRRKRKAVKTEVSPLAMPSGDRQGRHAEIPERCGDLQKRKPPAGGGRPASGEVIRSAGGEPNGIGEHLVTGLYFMASLGQGPSRGFLPCQGFLR
jgi:hypothetical protein